MPPKKRMATAAAAAGDEADAKRAKGPGGRAARRAGRADHEEDDLHEQQIDVAAGAHEQLHAKQELPPQAAVAEQAIEAALAQQPAKRMRKPSSKQLAAAQAALEEAAEEAHPPAEVATLHAQQLPGGYELPDQQPPPVHVEPLPPQLQPPQPQPQEPDPLPQQLPGGFQQQMAASDAMVTSASMQQQQLQEQPPPATLPPQLMPPHQQDFPQQQQQQQGLEEQGAVAILQETGIAAEGPGQIQQYDAAALAQQQQEAAAAAAAAALEQQQQDDADLLAAVVSGTVIHLGIALVVADEQGQEHHHEPVQIQIPPSATVDELKRRIERTDLHGQQFPSAQQDLQMVTTEGIAVQLDGTAPDGSLQTIENYGLTMPGSHVLYLRIKLAQYPEGYDASQGGLSDGQTQLNPDGTEKKKRRHHQRWKDYEVIKLLEGVETLGVGHWRQMQREFDLGHRTDVDLKDKWRNLTKAVGGNKKMRGVALPDDLRIRIQNCMRIQEEKRSSKSMGKIAEAATADPEAAAAAAQAAAEGSTLANVMAGAIDQSQDQDVHVDIGGLQPDPVALQDPNATAAAAHYAEQQQQHLQDAQHQALLQQQMQQQQQQAQPPQDTHTALQQPPPQQPQAHQQQQLDNDPGAVVMPVPTFEEEQQQGGDQSGPPTTAQLPNAPPLII